MPSVRAFLLLCFVVLAAGFARAQNPDPLQQDLPVVTPPDNQAALKGLQGEYLILVGGPALREWEDLRRSYQRHDNWWANFVGAANSRTRQFLAMGVPASSITWLVYRPGYERRSREAGKSLTAITRDLALKHRVRLAWFDKQDELINYVNSGNNRSSNKIVSFDFFGHSNKYCFLFDYSSEISGASVVWLHQREISRFSRSAFDRKAFCKSWGCHTGESMTRAWKSALGVPLYGALGKTDYGPVGRCQLPELSTAAGQWQR